MVLAFTVIAAIRLHDLKISSDSLNSFRSRPRHITPPKNKSSTRIGGRGRFERCRNDFCKASSPPDTAAYTSFSIHSTALALELAPESLMCDIVVDGLAPCTMLLAPVRELHHIARPDFLHWPALARCARPQPAVTIIVVPQRMRHATPSAPPARTSPPPPPRAPARAPAPADQSRTTLPVNQSRRPPCPTPSNHTFNFHN